ncbi:MAG: lipoate--protein ligase family protein, partial [Candidatus Omnitrophica bacterium]|nr:lipoate--protein ligase family protein [Candidatus Omnitrophota bacterium]
MIKKWRLILDKRSDGAWNMAVDEAILANYSNQRIPTLRIYGWQEPYISLGYSQEPEEVLRPDNAFPFVRRITGGGCILHHKEVTYSIVCALEDLGLPAGVKESYRMLCGFLFDFYRSLGLFASFAKDSQQADLRRPAAFCFSNWEEFDLVIAGKKIGGNAQRRKRNLIFQQGTIPQQLDFSQINRSIKHVFGASQKAGCLDDLLGHPTRFAFLSSLLAESFK